MAYPNITYTTTPDAEHADFVNTQGHTLQPHRKVEMDSYGSEYAPKPRKSLKTKLYGFSRTSLRKRTSVRRLVYTLCGCALIGIWIGVMIAFANQEEKYAETNRSRDIIPKGASAGIGLQGSAVLKGTLRQFDVASRALTVQWSGAIFNPSDPANFLPLLTDGTNLTNLATSVFGNATKPDFSLLPIAIYQDIVAIRDPTVESSVANIPELAGPAYRLENRTAKMVGSLGLHEWDSFDTDIDLTQANPNNVWQQPLFGYPFDIWSGSIVFTANIPVLADFLTNLTHSDTRGSVVLPFAHITLSDSILNWNIRASSTNTCVDEGNPSAATKNCDLHVDFIAKRPPIVIFCVIVVVLINWLTTVSIFLLTCESVFVERPHILFEIDILGVCLAALFALPSVRSLLPASPDFAALIDLIGIVPNVIIISICTTIVAFERIINRRAEGGERENAVARDD